MRPWALRPPRSGSTGARSIRPSVYCANDSAAWAPLNVSPLGGTPTDIMGTTLTKFAGGTCAMLKGYTGAAVDVANTSRGVYQHCARAACELG